jgi:hypothetical protein
MGLPAVAPPLTVIHALPCATDKTAKPTSAIIDLTDDEEPVSWSSFRQVVVLKLLDIGSRGQRTGFSMSLATG